MSKSKECLFYSRPGNEWPCSSCKTIRILEEEDHFTSPEQYYKTIGEEPKKGKWVRCVAANYNWCCSVCGCGFTDYRLNYCYDCGAKMEE